MMNYSTFTLENGMRVIHLPSDAKVVYCGIAVRAGTRNEAPGEEGLAHFCEHLSFKGTARRTATRIINDIEGLGGELNAFTNKEDTVYYCAIGADHLRRAIDVLTDIVFCSQYPPAEIEKECEVVCDEIESYEDSPAELIYDDFENLLFAGHPLGHNILGTAERVRSFTQDDVRRFTRRWYRPENCVLFVSGGKKIALKGAAPMAHEAHEPYKANGPHKPYEPHGPALPIIRHRSTHQAHVMIGSRAYAATDERRWALYLLNNILGGPGMNSRLNLNLRERHGLVYTVESTMVAYADTGLWSIYFGCDPGDVDRCRRLVRRELDRLADLQLSSARLTAAKRQLQGQLVIASDSREQFALDFAKNYLHTGTLRSLTDIMAHIDALTAQDLQLVARELFDPERLTTLIYT